MSFIKFIILYILIDSIWIIGNKEGHFNQIRLIQNEEPVIDKLAGLLFYIFSYIAFIKFVKPLSKSKEEAFKNGAMMGFLMYMTFDLTNKAIFKKYEWGYAIKDVMWGTFAFGVVSYLMFR